MSSKRSAILCRSSARAAAIGRTVRQGGGNEAAGDDERYPGASPVAPLPRDASLRRSSGSLCLCLSLLMLPWATGAVESLPTMQVTPAWDGHVRDGRATELFVSLIAPRGGEIGIELRSGATSVKAAAMLEPARELRLQLPLRTSGATPPVLRLTGQGRELGRETVPGLSLQGRPLVAVLGADEKVPGPDALSARLGATVFAPSLATLPRSAQAFEAISMLVLDAAVLDLLEAAQRDALAGFLAACGRVAVTTSRAETMDWLRTSAGCGGAFLRPVAAGEAGVAQLHALLREPAAALPGVSVLRELDAETRSRPGSMMVVLWTFYGLLLLSLAFRARRLRWSLAVPLVSAALLIGLWGRGGAGAGTVSWIEMHSGDLVARYVALLTVTGRGKGEAGLPLAASFGLPLALSGHELVFDRGVGMNGLNVLRFQTALMAAHEFGLAGVAGIEPPLRVYAREQRVVVRSGEQPTGEAVLGWRGQRFTVPPLAPHREWSPAGDAEPWQDLVSERVLRARTLAGAALLLPFTLTEAGLVRSAGHGQGWLMIHPAEEGAER